MAIATVTGIELNPKYIKAYINRGAARSAVDDFLGAIADYSRALELNPNDPYAFYLRAYNKSRMGDYFAAIKDYTIAIGLNPVFAEVFFNRALAKCDLGYSYGCCFDMKKAGELGLDKALDAYKKHCKEHH